MTVRVAYLFPAFAMKYKEPFGGVAAELCEVRAEYLCGPRRWWEKRD